MMDLKEFGPRLDRIADDLTELKVTAARQEENLKEHMRRTLLAEEGIRLARVAADAGLAEVRIEMKPVKDHVTMVNGALKFLGVLAILVGLALTIKQLIQ